METVNEVVRLKLEAYPKPEAQLALKAIELAEKYRNEASVAEQLNSVVRQLTREKK
jgi:hypothetical protein